MPTYYTAIILCSISMTNNDHLLCKSIKISNNFFINNNSFNNYISKIFFNLIKICNSNNSNCYNPTLNLHVKVGANRLMR